MPDSAYKRGYDAARKELSLELQKHNSQLAARLATLSSPQLLDAFGQPMGPAPISELDRAVMSGAIAANRTLLMFLGHMKGEGTGNELGLQPGD